MCDIMNDNNDTLSSKDHDNMYIHRVGLDGLTRLSEIHEEMSALLRESIEIVRDISPRQGPIAVAEGYWYGHIDTALGGQASSRRTHATTMYDTIVTLEQDIDDLLDD